MGPESKAQVVFNEDVEKTYAHIKKRCVVIRKEREEREKKRQEIAKGDPNEPVEIEVPEDATEYERKRAEAFRTFPPPFQRALLSGDLDKLNEVLSTMDSEEAERVLELCKSTGLLEIEEGVDEEMEEANPESTEEAKPETDDANQ
jgi:cell division cycle protein 37